MAAVAGLLLSVRAITRMGLEEWFKNSLEFDGRGPAPPPEDLEEERQARLDALATTAGAWMAALGTIIWAYGDLLGRVL